MNEQTQSNPALYTRDGIRVEIGQRWRDCDKRMLGRTCYVVDIDYEKQKVKMSHTMDAKRGTWVSVRRMYKHSTGWVLVG